MLDTIAQVPDNLHVVKRAMTCLMHCNRPLTLSELSASIAIDPREGVVDIGYQLDADEVLLDICGSLVTFSAETQLVGLGHFSVKQYFSSPVLLNGDDNVYFIDATTADAELCRICLHYLSSAPFKDSSLQQTVTDLDSLFARNPFLLYAAFQWPSHAARVGPGEHNEISDFVREFFREPPSRAYRLWSQLWQLAQGNSPFQMPHEGVQRLSRLTSYGLFKNRVMSDESGQLDNQEVPSLLYAAAFELTYVVKSLMADGVCVDGGQTNFIPLIAAAGAGNKDLVLTLLNAGADVNAREVTPRGQVYWSTFDKEVERVLTALGELFWDRTGVNCGRTALSISAKAGHTEVVEILLEHGANVDAKDDLGLTAMFYAAERGHTNIVKMLLDLGAKVDEYFVLIGRTPVAVALENNHPEVAKLLLDAYARSNLLPFCVETLDDHLISGDAIKNLVDTGGSVDDKQKRAARDEVIAIARSIFDAQLRHLCESEEHFQQQMASFDQSGEVAQALLHSGPYFRRAPVTPGLSRKYRFLLERTLLRSFKGMDEASLRDILPDLLQSI
jgi:ankyrin repeat protein